MIASVDFDMMKKALGATITEDYLFAQEKREGKAAGVIGSVETTNAREGLAMSHS
jgi:hypothetical protein